MAERQFIEGIPSSPEGLGTVTRDVADTEPPAWP